MKPIVPGSGEFDIGAFRPAAARLLGEGVFGRVYDLGDGTVLKIAREACAGIGSGRAKIESEHAALALLCDTRARNIVPAPRGHGTIPPSSRLVEEGFAVWLRSTRLPGSHVCAENIAKRPARGRSVIGREIGAALARVHAAIDDAVTRPGARSTRPEEARYGDIERAAREIGDPFYLDAIAKLERARNRIPPAILSRPSHGDFNLSNLLFAPDGQVCGVLDFAEWGADFPEKDLSDIVNELPVLAAPLLEAYENESGFRPDPVRLALGIAENALYGAVIGVRSGNPDSVAWGRELLAAQLQRLDDG